MGMMLSLGAMWIFTEVMHKSVEELITHVARSKL